MDTQTITPEFEPKNQEEEPMPQSGGFWGFILEIVKFAVIAAAVVAPIRLFIAQPFIVKGESMDPTFADGQYLIVDEITYYTKPPERGDVIIFKYPKDPSKYFIKRIVGLPNETVIMENGKVIIKTTGNPIGLPLAEPYIKNSSSDNLTMQLGEDEYFVMGDNRRNSLDSRAWGPLPRENIIGRTLVRLFPIDEVGFFPGTVNDVSSKN